MVPGRDTRATEAPWLARPLLTGEEPLGLKPLIVVIPFERLALSSVMEDGPASEFRLMDAEDGILSERGMYMLSVEVVCAWGVRWMVAREVVLVVLVVWVAIRCLLWGLGGSARVCL